MSLYPVVQSTFNCRSNSFEKKRGSSILYATVILCVELEETSTALRYILKIW
jgi:hypothetical protein